MIVAGIMSGTSADGIDVALVEFSLAPKSGKTGVSRKTTAGSSRAQKGAQRVRGTSLQFLGHAELPYPADVRRLVLASMNSPRASVADLARLNFLLGDLYAEAVLSAQRRLNLKAELVGCHGQTLYHQGRPATFLGRQLAVTWQAGDGSRMAVKLGVPVVSDFRPADMAAGGKGAPLVPFLDYLLYRDSSLGRVMLNIGGIANVTALPPGAMLDQVIAFDTGPGNMVIDALTEQLFGEPCDRDGKIAASGRVLEDTARRFVGESYFRQKPPKTAGREEFGREFAREFLHACNMWGKGHDTPVEKKDVIATATAFTALSIRDALRLYVVKRGKFSELIASGGGTKNPTLMQALASGVEDLRLEVRSSDEFGIPSGAKEAVAFAALAYETWNRRPSNVPSATGAKRPVVLGKISLP
jgi:anhydro-N-acetylmuramic acid kinase